MDKDWRLFGNDDLMFGKTLQHKAYKAPSEQWDHDHCTFCGAKFSTIIPDSLTEGYATENDYYWVCQTCFDDFKEELKFVVLQ